MNPDGNERLTTAVGALLLVPFAIEIATILLGVHTFMSTHVFVGFLLIPPVLLKLGSTGWRFVRYYTRNGVYVMHGPPQILMRAIAPVFVAATVVLFGSGVAMGFLHGHALSIARSLHGPASVVWLVLLGMHVLIYLNRVLALGARRPSISGAKRRAAAILVAVIAGLAIGGATVPAQHRWIELRHDHHHDG